MKTCSKCYQEKNLSCFGVNNGMNDGLSKICKECRRAGYKKSSNAKKIDFYIKQSIIRSIRKNRSGYIWERVLGFTLLDLKTHLGHNFSSEMNWENYGSFWGIALIIPKSYYHYNGINGEFRKCWSLKNMYPLEISKCIKRKIDIELVKKHNLYDCLPTGLLLDKIL